MVLLAFASQDQVLVCCYYRPKWSQVKGYVDRKNRTLAEICAEVFYVIHLPAVEKQMCGSTSCFDKLLVEAFVIIFHFHRIEGPEQRIFSDVTHGFSFHVLHIIDLFRVPWKLRNCRGAC